jgi:hypothetical protein
MNKIERMTVCLQSAQYRQLKATAIEQNISVSALIRGILTNATELEKSAQIQLEKSARMQLEILAILRSQIPQDQETKIYTYLEKLKEQEGII